ncbi:DUF262 domain-containing protein [Hoyosella subflava]|uniref:DUF262 domain-containing protein n=1 Tax=Hoyosella subflava (strain DSM 45089 / JCM 17490 / NBRC 109087 / DQS3-9A1) TaxID=443218 RepID=F6EJ50_HOYSD|nr:DUF262 domain-containing HNH endonuclease family protein [Hoyosella subflava]AEF41282.1 hypothetical protein AS9A_2835 [Hoyosella subflava DQS3-9A1]
MVEIKEIFDAAPLSVSQFLSDPGQGLYIPPYQRPYSWDRENVRRLLDDIGHGADQLRDVPDSITFLGTVIAIRDINYVTVEPVVRSEVPARVTTIIDGQQRITTLLILLTVLHEEIRVLAGALDAAKPTHSWCRNQATDVAARLAATFQENMHFGSGDYQYYPRMIRAYVDVWSRDSEQASYTSAIASYLFSYARHARKEDSDSDYEFPSVPESVEAAGHGEPYKHLQNIRKFIQKSLRDAYKQVTLNKRSETFLVTPAQIKSSYALQEALFNAALPDLISTEIEKDLQLGKLLSLIVWANYALKRVTVAVVTAKREDYGFDMFEALNTTGEPLTALETFKPRVIRELGLATWRKSNSKQSFDKVESYLEWHAGASPQKRQTETQNLLISFALMQSGDKLGKRLSEQRNYLRKHFDEEGSSTGREAYVNALVQLVNFLQGPWAEPQSVNSQGSAIEDEAAFALAVLREGKHEIVIPILARYYAAYRLAESDRADAAHEEFLSACRACLAFYALWRGAHRGTAQIDNIYRSIMRPSSDGGIHWARGADGVLEDVPPAAELKSRLWAELGAAGIKEPERWAQNVARNPIGSSAKVLTRLLLLAASQDSVPDRSVPGLTVRGRAGVLKMMTLSMWHDASLKTIEHTAPQKVTAQGWHASLLDNNDIINTLGNLTLLPARENSSAGNRSWNLKRLFYQVLSASTVDAAEELLAQAAHVGLELNSGAQQIVRQAPYLPLVAAVAGRSGDWDADFVLVRSHRLSLLAWDALVPWLHPSELD